MDTLQLESYRKKGINAYAVPLQGLRWEHNECDYGLPLTQKDRELAYKEKPHTVGIDLSKPKFLNCYLKYKEANGHRTVYGWLLINDGEIMEQWDSEEEYVLHLASKYFGELPELEGTERQCKWAENIRARVIIEMSYEAIDNWDLHREIINSRNKSKDWIEGFGTENPSAIAQTLITSL